MKQTLEEAAKIHRKKEFPDGEYPIGIKDIEQQCEEDFIKGAEWQAKQSPWISVKERLPEEGQRILVGFLYYYKYADREVESRKHIDIFTYENRWWIDDSDNSYLGKDVTEYDIKVICWQPIPSFDEILKAEQDVLERIKEKGD
jgi:hypothetical protein